MTAGDRARELVEQRVELAREVVSTAGRFPVYEVPPEVAERFPAFDPANPETWPEPEKCTEGRPWGIDAYGSVWGDPAGRWRSYLARQSRPCRNRWRDPELRLCGTHVNAYRQLVTDNERRLARFERERTHRDLAQRLAAHGIEADSSAAGVFLLAPAAEQLLAILDEAVRRAGGTITSAVHLVDLS